MRFRKVLTVYSCVFPSPPPATTGGILRILRDASRPIPLIEPYVFTLFGARSAPESLWGALGPRIRDALCLKPKGGEGVPPTPLS